eukprot:4857578-Amphidinium_carterae.1
MATSKSLSTQRAKMREAFVEKVIRFTHPKGLMPRKFAYLQPGPELQSTLARIRLDRGMLKCPSSSLVAVTLT